ncbi:hypothetical protein BH09BAC5_BH09BAC5_15810 [soil metagenome]
MMLRFSAVMILSCLLPLFAAAQLFLPVDDDPFSVPVKFNVDSISRYHIKSITANLQYKPDEHIISDKGLKEYYQFDSIGRIKMYWRNRVRNYTSDVIQHPAIIRKGKKIKSEWSEVRNYYVYDTVFVNYYYDYKSQLTCRRECDGDFYHTWYYLYNTDGTIARQTHCRETNVGAGHWNFRLGVQTIISQEDFAYQKYSPTQIKKQCLNDEGKPYKETMLLLDKQGRIIDARESYTAGGIRIVTTWKYDSLGRTASTSYTSNAGDAIADITQFNYDSLGRIISMKKYHNEKLTDEFSYLYEKNSPVSYAYINRRYLELGIDIVKMDIIYWQ